MDRQTRDKDRAEWKRKESGGRSRVNEYRRNRMIGGGSLTNRAALPPYLPQFRGNRSPRYFIDMPTIDIHRSR